MYLLHCLTDSIRQLLLFNSDFLSFILGLNRLLSNNSYEAAFPLHEVIWLISVKPFIN